MARTCCFAHLFFFFFLQQTFTEHLPTPRTTLIPGEAKMTEVVFYRTSAVRPGTIGGPGRALVASTRLCRRGSGVAPGGPGGSGRRRRWWWGGTWCWRWHCPVWGRCHRCGCRGSWRRPRWFGWGGGGSGAGPGAPAGDARRGGRDSRFNREDEFGVVTVVSATAF